MYLVLLHYQTDAGFVCGGVEALDPVARIATERYHQVFLWSDSFLCG